MTGRARPEPVSTINVSQSLAIDVLIRCAAMPQLLGYVRVSTTDQNNDLQLVALKAAGCHRLFVDTASGALDERRELARMLGQRGPSRRRPREALVVQPLWPASASRIWTTDLSTGWS
jgi:hypothetical protein